MAQNINLPDITYKEYNERLRTPEQELAETLLLKHKRFVLGFEPGKGKTYPVIHAMLEVQRMKGRPIQLLVMSDATCIREIWKAEILPQNILPASTYFVTDRTAIGTVSQALVKRKWDVIIIDEAQSLRSGVTRKKSKYARLVYSLTRRTEYVFGITGTLSGNNNIEPWCVLHNLNIAGQGTISTYSFKNNCCVLELQYGPFGNFMKPTKLHERGEKLLTAAYQNGVMFWAYDESDEMPPMTVEMKTFKVPLTKEYKNAIEGILKLGEFESTTIKAIALQKAQQALNGFIYYEDLGERQIYDIDEYINPKLKFVIEEAKRELTIVGYRFQEDGRVIQEALTKVGISWTTDISTFRNRKTQVLVLQSSRGKAANLQFCRNIVYYTSDFSFISYKQFIHRTWRRGQTEPCKVTFLINDPGDRHKVEFKIWQSLRNKQNIHDLLMSIKQV